MTRAQILAVLSMVAAYTPATQASVPGTGFTGALAGFGL